MNGSDGMVHKVAFIWVVVAVFVALAGGFALGMYIGQGELKRPTAGVSYKLVIVAKSGKGVSARYYPIGKYSPIIQELERGLTDKTAVFENGVFRIEDSKKDSK